MFFLTFILSLLPLPHPTSSAITAHAHPHTTDVAVYPTLFADDVFLYSVCLSWLSAWLTNHATAPSQGVTTPAHIPRDFLNINPSQTACNRGGYVFRLVFITTDSAIPLIFVRFSTMPEQVVDPAHIPAIDICPVSGLITAPANRNVNLTSPLMLSLFSKQRLF